MNIKVGNIPNLQWWRLKDMSDKEIEDFNNKYTIIEGETKMTDDNLNDTQQKLYTSTLQEHDKAVWNEAIEAAIAKCISLSEQHDWSPGYQRAAKVVSDKIRQLKK